MTAWAKWFLPRAVFVSLALTLLGVDTWMAFAAAGIMLSILRERTA